MTVANRASSTRQLEPGNAGVGILHSCCTHFYSLLLANGLKTVPMIHGRSLTYAIFVDTSEGAGQLGDRLRGGFVDRIAMAEDGALKREFRELLNTLVRLSHIGRVLRIGTAARCRCCSWRRRG